MWLRKKSTGHFQWTWQVFWMNVLGGLLLASIGLRYPGSLDRPKILHLPSFLFTLSTECIEGVLILGCCIHVNSGWVGHTWSLGHKWLGQMTCSRSWVGKRCLSFSMTRMKQWSDSFTLPWMLELTRKSSSRWLALIDSRLPFGIFLLLLDWANERCNMANWLLIFRYSWPVIHLSFIIRKLPSLCWRFLTYILHHQHLRKIYQKQLQN